MSDSNSFWMYKVPEPFSATERLVVEQDGSIHLRDQQGKSVAMITMETAYELLGREMLERKNGYVVGGIVASSAYGVGNAFGGTSHYAESIYGHGFGTCGYGADGISDGSGRGKNK